MTTLISFLGKQQKGYRTAKYRFPDKDRVVTFFGMALNEFLCPENLILAGTSSSMWDVFFEYQQAGGDDAERLKMIEAEENKKVDAAMLDRCAKRLGESLRIPVKCLLIDYARNESEQIGLLRRLADCLVDNEKIHVDVTHSFRHLPMLALVAARYLAKIKQIETINIWYGVLEMTDPPSPSPDGITPVIQLKGLLDMLDWVDALAAYDKDGDYGGFSSLLRRAGDDRKADLLQKASFYERTNQPAQARSPLKNILRSLEPDAFNSPMTDLFRPALKKRLSWVENDRYAERQAGLARQMLNNGNYVQAAIQGFESVISALVYKNGGDPLLYDDRDKIKKDLEKKITEAGCNKSPAQCAYLDLRDLRNALAHGSRPEGSVQSAISSEERLRAFLDEKLTLVANLS